MDNLEPKKLALIRIWEVLHKYSDYRHPMTQNEIGKKLEKDYGIIIERKAIGRNISLLKEAGVEIITEKNGSYIDVREFEDAELHMLIDGVLSSKYITAAHSKDLIERLCQLSNKYFKVSKLLTILLLSVILTPSIGTLKSHLITTLLLLTSISFNVFIYSFLFIKTHYFS